MEENYNKPMTEKTLMNSLDRIRDRANHIDEVKRMSHRMINKINGRDSEKEPVDDGGKLADTPRDIIDMFNEVSAEIEESTKIISDNIDEMIKKIG